MEIVDWKYLTLFTAWKWLKVVQLDSRNKIKHMPACFWLKYFHQRKSMKSFKQLYCLTLHSIFSRYKFFSLCSSVLCFNHLCTFFPSLSSTAPHTEFSQSRRRGGRLVGAGRAFWLLQVNMESVLSVTLGCRTANTQPRRSPAVICVLKRLQKPLSDCL